MKTFFHCLMAMVTMFAMPMAMAQSSTLKAGDPVQIELKAPAEDAAVFGGNYTISETGTVKVPHLDQEISAVGLSTSQLSRKIELAYKAADIYTNPTIIVNMQNPTTYIPHVVNVGGSVRQPGEVPLRENMRLFQAITRAGGFTEFARQKEIKLVRGNRETKYDMRSIRADGSNNPFLQDGDQIIVPGG